MAGANDATRFAPLKLEGWKARVAVAIGYRIYRLWAWTLRYELEDRAEIAGKRPGAPLIFVEWHNRLMLFPYVLRRFRPETRGYALVSASRDGALVGDFIKSFGGGFGVVRGSSSRRGAAALIELAECLADGADVAITPDGPRGPIYSLGPGIIFLAQRTGADVVPVALEFGSAWRLKSWDRFFLPKPFSKVRVIFAKPHRVAATTTEVEFEAERLRLHHALLALVEQR